MKRAVRYPPVFRSVFQSLKTRAPLPRSRHFKLNTRIPSSPLPLRFPPNLSARLDRMPGSRWFAVRLIPPSTASVRTASTSAASKKSSEIGTAFAAATISLSLKPKPRVSREHAYIRFDAESGKFRLYDSMSQRGTSLFREGRRLETPKGPRRGRSVAVRGRNSFGRGTDFV